MDARVLDPFHRLFFPREVTMDGNVRHHYDRSVDDVLALITDPDFLKRRAEAVGEKNVVVRVDRDGARMTIRLERDVESSLPGFMKKLFNPTNHLVDSQTWDTAGQVKTSDWSVEVSGQKRVQIRGRLSLAPASSGGCDYIEAFTVSVAIPLVGGRIEKYVLGETESSIRQQFDFTVKELGSRGS
jgi:hypothetical protein